MNEKEIDAIYFTAQTALKLNFHQHTIQIIDSLIERKPLLPVNILELYIEAYLHQLEKLDDTLSTVKQKLDTADSSTKMFQIRGLQQLRSQFQSKLIKFHDEFLDKMQNKLVPSNPDYMSQFILLKSIGDAHRYIGKHITGESQKSKIALAKDSYEKALTFAESHIDHKDPIYLKFILNWTSFQFTFVKIKELPTKTLFQAYREGVTLLDKVDSKQRQEYLRVLDVMKRNMATVSTDDEPKEE